MDEEMSIEEPEQSHFDATGLPLDPEMIQTQNVASQQEKEVAKRDTMHFIDTFVKKHESRTGTVIQIRRKLASLTERPRALLKSRRWILSLRNVSRYNELTAYLKMIPEFKYYRTIKLFRRNESFKYRIYCVFKISVGLYRELLCGARTYRCTVAHQEVMQAFNTIKDQVEEYGDSTGMAEYRGMNDTQLLSVPDRNDLCYKDQLRYIGKLIDKYKAHDVNTRITNKKVYFVHGKEELMNQWVKEQLKEYSYDIAQYDEDRFSGMSMDETIKKVWFCRFISKEMDIKQFLIFIIPVITYFHCSDYDQSVPNRYDTVFITSSEDPETIYSENPRFSEIIHRFITEVYINDDGSVVVKEPRPDTDHEAEQFAIDYDKFCN